jgi:hypothetical protein
MPGASAGRPVTASSTIPQFVRFLQTPLIIDVVTRPVQSLLVGISERSKTQLKGFITSCVRLLLLGLPATTLRVLVSVLVSIWRRTTYRRIDSNTEKCSAISIYKHPETMSEKLTR